MKKITLKHKVFFITLFGVMGALTPMMTSAVIPSTAGTIHACKTDSDGQMRFNAQSSSCAAGESSMQWDRGLVGFAYAPQAVDSDMTEFTEGNVSVSITNVYSEGMTSACVDIPSAIASETRFVTVNGAANDLVLRDDAISSTELNERCGTSYEGLMKSQSVVEGTTLLFY
jgi:hypothetical protein